MKQPEESEISAIRPFRAYWKTYPPEGGMYSTRLLVIEVMYGNGEIRKVSCTSDQALELAAILASERVTHETQGFNSPPASNLQSAP